MINQTPAQSSRALRYKHRNFLHTHSKLKRVARCGLFGVGAHVGLRLGGTKSKPIAGVSGIETCGSVWSCPVCSAKIAQHRNVELNKVNKAWRDRGGHVLFATFTMRHKYEDNLENLWDGLSASWRRLVSGKGYQNLKARYGIEGYVRVVEVTHGSNGWHVHTHTAIYLSQELSEAEMADLQGTLYSRWVLALDKDGFTASQAHGVDVKRAYESSGLGAYMTKSSMLYENLSMEITHGLQNKTARKGNRTPFAILSDLDNSYNDSDFALWSVWESVSRGRRMMTWSVGLRELANLSRELTDEEIVLLAQLEGTTVLSVPTKNWASIVRNGRAPRVLDTLEAYGVPMLIDLLASWDIPCTIYVNPLTFELADKKELKDEKR